MGLSSHKWHVLVLQLLRRLLERLVERVVAHEQQVKHLNS